MKAPRKPKQGMPGMTPEFRRAQREDRLARGTGAYAEIMAGVTTPEVRRARLRTVILQRRLTDRRVPRADLTFRAAFELTYGEPLIVGSELVRTAA